MDNTSPIIDIVSPKTAYKFIDLVFIKGSIRDEYLDSYDISIADGENPSDESFRFLKSVNNDKIILLFKVTLQY